MLNDKTLFGNINNLDINPNNPFGKYKSQGNLLSTVNSGMRYQKAYKTMVQDKENDFLLPIIFACDKTQVTNLSKATSWPLLFTTSILNQEMRNKLNAWCLLGYIPNSTTYTSPKQEQQFSIDLKYTRLHQMLKQYWHLMLNFKRESFESHISYIWKLYKEVKT